MGTGWQLPGSLSLTVALGVAASVLSAIPVVPAGAAVMSAPPPGTVSTYAGGLGPTTPSAAPTVGQYPNGVAVRGSNVYTTDAGGWGWPFSAVRVLDTTTGKQTILAGTLSNGYAGDGGPATAATLNGPTDVALDSSGNIYIADTGNNVVREINTSGIITTVAGTGQAGYSDTGTAKTSMLHLPRHITLDGQGDLFIADVGNLRVREVKPDGSIKTVAGGGAGPNSVPCGSGAATTVLLQPFGLAVDGSGNLYVASYNLICKVDTSGNIGRFSPPDLANNPFNQLEGMSFDAHGNLFVADYNGVRIFRSRRTGPRPGLQA